MDSQLSLCYAYLLLSVCELRCDVVGLPFNSQVHSSPDAQEQTGRAKDDRKIGSRHKGTNIL